LSAGTHAIPPIRWRTARTSPQWYTSRCRPAWSWSAGPRPLRNR
jgi:hypothetical protein